MRTTRKLTPRRFGIAVTGAWLGMFLWPASAEDPLQRLEQIERGVTEQRQQVEHLDSKVQVLEGEITTLQRNLVTYAHNERVLADGIAELETRITRLHKDYTSKSNAMKKRQDLLRNTLSAFIRLSRLPPELLLVQPISPNEMVRSAVLLRDILPKIDAMGKAIRRDMAAMGITRQELHQQHSVLAHRRQALQVQQRQVNALLARKAGLKRNTETAHKQTQERLERLVDEAETLQELLAKLKSKGTRTTEQSAREQIGQQQLAAVIQDRDFTKERGGLSYPVTGAIVSHYGDVNNHGIRQKGISFRIQPAQVGDVRVIAPHMGVVEFAGKFRGYGLLLIIRHSAKYHSLLAGLGEIYVETGQQVLRGEPIGAMEKGDEPTLYMELRRDGNVINPLPWFAKQQPLGRITAQG